MKIKKTKNGLSHKELKAHLGTLLKQEPQKIGHPNGILDSYFYRELQREEVREIIPFETLVLDYDASHKLSEYCMEVKHCLKHQKEFPLLVIKGSEGMGKRTIVESLRKHLGLGDELQIINGPEFVDTTKLQVLITEGFQPFFLKDHLYFLDLPDDYYGELEEELVKYFCGKYFFEGDGNLLKLFKDKKVAIMPAPMDSIFARASKKAKLRGEEFRELHVEEALNILPKTVSLMGAEEIKALNTRDEMVVDQKVGEGIDEIISRASSSMDYQFLNKTKNYRSVVSLFSGPSGVGKTMTCRVIAHELKKPLWMVSIPQVLSRYVGDSEKVLQGLFKEAERADVILLFDEVDSLAIDRKYLGSIWQRTLSNTLLNLIDAYEGVIVMTTNFSEHLDKALNRRINHKIKFPQPSLEQRAEILRRHLLPDAPITKNFNFKKCVKDLEVNGGQIKNAVERLGIFLAKNEKKTISVKVMRDLLLKVLEESTHLQESKRRIGI